MATNMTFIRSVAIAGLCLLAAGCDLEQNPVSSTDAESVFGTEAGLELYSNSFSEVLPGVNDILHGDAMSDYVAPERAGFHPPRCLYSHQHRYLVVGSAT